MDKRELVCDIRDGRWIDGVVDSPFWIKELDINWEQRRWELFNSAVSGLSTRVDLVAGDIVRIARCISDMGIDVYLETKK